MGMATGWRLRQDIRLQSDGSLGEWRGGLESKSVCHSGQSHSSGVDFKFSCCGSFPSGWCFSCRVRVGVWLRRAQPLEGTWGRTAVSMVTPRHCPLTPSCDVLFIGRSGRVKGERQRPKDPSIVNPCVTKFRWFSPDLVQMVQSSSGLFLVPQPDGGCRFYCYPVAFCCYEFLID